jgi:hypothetical protein
MKVREREESKEKKKKKKKKKKKEKERQVGPYWALLSSPVIGQTEVEFYIHDDP